MKKSGYFILPVLLVTVTAYAHPVMHIRLKHRSPDEVQTRAQLKRLISNYDLSNWIFTTSVLIDKDSIPHSNPILTLHTRHLKDDELLLSTFIHEQLHWFLDKHQKSTEAAIKALKTIFPKVPVGYPEGAKTEASTYLHLIVCYLEYRADEQLLGELKAKEVMWFWSTDHYTWVYKIALKRSSALKRIVFKYNLVPGRVTSS